MLDLFGSIAISTNDVELWLDNLPNFNITTASNRREQYAKYYDLARIIADAKLNGSFALLEKQQTDFIERRQVSRYQTQYAKTQAELDVELSAPCPNYFHICTVKSCNVRIKIARSNRNKRYYRKKNNTCHVLSEYQKTPFDLKTLTKK